MRNKYGKMATRCSNPRANTFHLARSLASHSRNLENRCLLVVCGQTENVKLQGTFNKSTQEGSAGSNYSKLFKQSNGRQSYIILDIYKPYSAEFKRIATTTFGPRFALPNIRKHPAIASVFSTQTKLFLVVLVSRLERVAWSQVRNLIFNATE